MLANEAVPDEPSCVIECLVIPDISVPEKNSFGKCKIPYSGVYSTQNTGRCRQLLTLHFPSMEPGYR